MTKYRFIAIYRKKVGRILKRDDFTWIIYYAEDREEAIRTAKREGKRLGEIIFLGVELGYCEKLWRR